ncbi:TetR/AcrR family transcriptional regulator [Conexibacter sp. SYSU D00693]|uniref:TetR/AcrR family transcriptional regulator n=1 Tax=Conexibacter sp. SYSU D00693 TaxID=2812560 RepID=UPI00196AC1A5|nr:TetR/AcrR family transcriptional regulator [Conexibacter sp. SYSU D00693]
MAEPRQLPRGRHGLSREEVLASQRGRMLAAMADAVAEHGYARTTVAHVIKGARVSRETFYEQFADKEACFLAAYDHGVQHMQTRMREGLEEASGPPQERLRRALDAYFAAFLDRPSFARTFLVEVYAAGPAALERRAELQATFVELVAHVLGARDADARFRAEALVAAVSSLVTTRVSLGRLEELPTLREPLLALVDELFELG